MLINEISNAPNWAKLAKSLLQGFENPEASGCVSREDLMRRVATLREVNTQSLRKAVDAYQFLVAEQPDLVGEDVRPPSLPKVLILRAIFNLDALKGRELLAAAGTLERTLGSLKAELGQMRGAASTDGPHITPRGEAKLRGYKYVASVEMYLRTNKSEFGANEVISPHSKTTIEPPCDLILHMNTGEAVAVEIKGPSISQHRKVGYDLLGLGLLWQQQSYGVWIICHPTWEDTLKQMLNSAERLGFKKFAFAIYEEHPESGPILRWIE